jgi:tetratricopeptide (TPR) repeat protein
MGWFFKKRRPPSPEELREALFEAVTSGDQSRARELVAGSEAAIREQFPAWQKVPEPIRDDRAALQRYMAGLIGVAEHFKNERQDPSLLERLTGPPGSNPLTRWEKALRTAQEAMEAARYAEAEALLEEQRAAARGLSGSGVDRYLPITIGYLGQCRFHQGRAQEAIALFGEALAICERTGDLEGKIAYASNLHEAHRWLGQTAEAAAFADRLAERCDEAGNAPRAAWARRRARAVRAGEPLNRVVVEAGGRELELDEIGPAAPTERVRFHFVRNRIELGAVTALVDEASRRGGSGDDAGVLAVLRAAIEIDPSDPRPRYLSGLAQLGLRRYRDAIESYDATEHLAPGWYHCRADGALARGLDAGRVSHATFEAVRRIEDGGKPARERAALAEVALAAAPDLPVLHLLAANALRELGSTADAQKAARAGLAREPDPDVRTRLLVTLANASRPAERRPLLEEAIALDGNRIAAAMARVMLLPREVS